MMQGWSWRASLGALCATLALPNAAYAESAEQTRDEQGLGDDGAIVVTAQKRESSIQKVPLSITAVSSATIERSGINTLDSVRLLSPGMNMSAVGSGFVSYTYIRGAGTNVIDAGSDPSVAYFMDEVYLAGTAGLQFDLLDVERVEVLKGPQGTLFGRNAAGGAISIISKRPSRTFDAWATIEGGNYGQVAARAGITGPIGDSWSYRLSAAHRQRDAFTENPAGRDPGSIDTYAGRGQLMYEGGNLTALLSADYFTSDNGMTNQFPTTALTSSLIAPTAAAQPADQSFYRRYYNVEGFEKQTAYSITGRFELDLGAAKLTSISAYRNNHFERLQDQEGTILDVYSLASDARDETFSQELRLSGETDSLQWIAGLYYYNGLTDRIDTLDSGPDYAVAAARNSIGSYHQRIRAKSYAAFGQLTYEIVPGLSATVGARYSRDEKQSNQDTDPLGPVGRYTVQLTPSWNSLDPAVVVQYEPSPDIMFYGSFRQGFKSGGFQALPANLTLASSVYAPEDVKSFEAGFKTQWFDRHVRFNAAFFNTSIGNQQILRVPSAGLTIIDNAGRTRTRGVDISLQGRIGDFLTIDWSSTIQKARFRQYLSNCSGTPPVCTTNFAGNQQLRSPDFQTSVVADLKVPLGNGSGKLNVRAEYFYQSKIFFDASNIQLPGAFQPGYGLLNGRLSYETESGKLSIALFVKNLTNKQYFRNVAIVGNTGVAAPGDPQTFGVSLNWRL
ncbi:MAG: TonB-dependent receptor [Novosphingobium sp.]|nr:TonB-dependent receptor [Novosphingobium sp.]